MRQARSRSKTDAFIDRYIMEEGGTGKGFGLYKMVAESKGADKAKIASVIRKMDYDDFMKTRYWQLVAQQVKHDAGWRCEDCGSRHGLVAHHDDYKRHGFECTTWPNCIAFARPATSGGTALGLNILKYKYSRQFRAGGKSARSLAL